MCVPCNSKLCWAYSFNQFPPLLTGWGGGVLQSVLVSKIMHGAQRLVVGSLTTTTPFETHLLECHVMAA